MSPEPERAARSVLVVDDDDVFRTRLGKAFQDRGFDVRTAYSAAEAIRLAQQDSPEFAIVDLRCQVRRGSMSSVSFTPSIPRA